MTTQFSKSDIQLFLKHINAANKFNPGEKYFSFRQFDLYVYQVVNDHHELTVLSDILEFVNRKMDLNDGMSCEELIDEEITKREGDQTPDQINALQTALTTMQQYNQKYGDTKLYSYDKVLFDAINNQTFEPLSWNEFIDAAKNILTTD